LDGAGFDGVEFVRRKEHRSVWLEEGVNPVMGGGGTVLC